MNWKQIKKMRERLVQLRPKVIKQNKWGESEEFDCIWIIDNIIDNTTQKGIDLKEINNYPSHIFTLPKDDIKQYKENIKPRRPETSDGFFHLFSQVLITSNRIRLDPLKK